MKKLIFSILFASMSLSGMAQSFNGDYASVGVYDMWEKSPFRTGQLNGNVQVIENHLYSANGVNRTGHILGVQRSRFGSNTFGAKVTLNSPVTIGRSGKYVHALVYTPHASKVQFIGLGKRTSNTWNESNDVEQFWSDPVSISANTWTDIVAQVYTNENVEIHSIVVVPDCSSPNGLSADFIAYIDEIVVNSSSSKRSNVSSSIDPYDSGGGGDDPGPEPSGGLYPTNFDKSTVNNTSRYIKGVKLTNKKNNRTQRYPATSSNNPLCSTIYFDATSLVTFNVDAGQSYTPAVEYQGSDMHALAYVDYTRDGEFTNSLTSNKYNNLYTYYTINEGSELVTFSSYAYDYTGGTTGHYFKSNGTYIGQGEYNMTMPSFTIPSDLQTGYYRMRYKIDFNNLDAGGNDGSLYGNYIADNGGAIVDILLYVTGSNDVSVKGANLYNGTIKNANGNDITTTGVTGTYNQEYTVNMVPASGFETVNLKANYKINSTTYPGHLDDASETYTTSSNNYNSSSDAFTLPANVMYSAVILEPLYNQIQYTELYDTDTEYSSDAGSQYVRLHRTLTADSWNSLCLPFDHAIPEGWSVVEIGSTSQNGDNVLITFVPKTGTLEAGKPYLVKPTEDVETIISEGKLQTMAEGPITVTEGLINFVPTFVKSQVPQGGYYVKTSSNKLLEATQARNMKGYRAYFTVNGNGIKGLNSSLEEEDATLIDNIAAGNNITAVYNMSGVKTSGLRKGVNIVRTADGKVQKIVIR